MKLVLPVLASALVLVAPAHAGGKPEPVTTVLLAKSWAAALDEAKALNVPIVVHSHGFYCPPCWGMHSAVMCNKKYIEFANENTVEVICLSALEEGIDKKDRKAETYEAKVDGKTVEYLCEFPGLTVDDMKGLQSSKASSYNDTGKTPYTCVVDPWNEEKIVGWNGGQGAGTIMDAVTEARKAMTKEHGKGVSRKDVRTLADAEREAAARREKGDYAAAIDRLGKVAAKADKWPEPLKARFEAAKRAVVDEAEKALAAVEEKKASDPAAAKKELTALATRLKGTGLEEKAKELLASL